MPKPYVCPVCNGFAKVSRPPWVPGDVPSWGSSSIDSYPCPACEASGVLWWDEIEMKQAPKPAPDPEYEAHKAKAESALAAMNPIHDKACVWPTRLP